MTHTIEDQERAAYLAGDTDRASLLARIADLENQVLELEVCIDDTRTIEQWNDDNGSADDYKEFFYDCFALLKGHYPCPSISSDYDKSVIFDAITKGEGVTE